MSLPHVLRTLREYLCDLSPKAQAVAGVAGILATQSRTGTFSVAELRGVFDMRDDAEWKAVYDELYEHAVLYFVDGGHDEAEVMFGGDILSAAMGPPGRPSAKEWARQRVWLEQSLEGQEPFCLYCRATDLPLAIDHLRPISRGGSNHLSNLAFACKSCNSAKGAKTYQEFMRRRKELGL